MAIQERRAAYVVFRLAGQRYAVAASCVERITAMVELDVVPNAPKLLAGFLNLEGTPLPVIRLCHLLQQAETPVELWTPLVVVRCGGERLALLVDRVEQVLDVEKSALLPLPPGHALNDCIDGLVRVGGDSVLVISPERLLLQQERRTVNELRQIAEQRLRELEGADA